MFTKEQIDEIKERLAQDGAKDTQFEEATSPFSGSEYVAIIQGGKNKKVSIGALYSEFSMAHMDWDTLTLAEIDAICDN